MVPRLFFTALALACLVWATGFARATYATIRKGVPFHITGHRQGSMPVGASFGPIGAVMITGVVLMITYMAMNAAIAVWTDTSGYFD